MQLFNSPNGLDINKNIILKSEGSHPKYSAMPPQTPAIILLFDLTKAFFILYFLVLRYSAFILFRERAKINFT